MRSVKTFHSPLFFRMLRRSLTVRRSHSGAALLALVVAACVATAMLTLYFDLDAKLHKEFRAYGANVVVAARDGQPLPPGALHQIESALPPQSLAVPFGYAVAHTTEGSAVVVSGADFDRVKRLNHWWAVTSWPASPQDALVGERALRGLGGDGPTRTLVFGDKALPFRIAGTLKTGADEENRIYISLPEFESWTGLQPSTVEVSIPGSRDQIDSAIQRLGTILPEAEARPIRQIVDAEAGVISRTKLLMLVSLLLIAVTVALCVLATLTSSVLERRRDFAVMKALGSSQALLNVIFAGEAALLGLAGAVVGYIIGLGFAAWIGHVNFHALVLPRIRVFPIVLAGTIAVALLAAWFPLSKLQRIEPAGILKGE